MDSTKLGLPADQRTHDISTFSTPFDNFLHYVPKEHEVAVRQAFFNAVAIAIFLVVGVGGYYVSAILGPFLMPLFWAILTGFVLHPYKFSLSIWMRETILQLESSESPCIVTCCQMGFGWAFRICDMVGNFIFNRIKFFLISSTLFIASIYLTQATTLSFEWLHELASYLWNLRMLSFIENINLFQICLLLVILVATLVVQANREESTFAILQLGFASFWISIICYILNIIWSPFSIIFLLIATFVALYKRTINSKKDEPDGSDENSAVKNLLKQFMNNFVQHDEPTEILTTVTETKEEENEAKDIDGKKRTEDLQPESSTPNVEASVIKRPELPFTADIIQHPGVSALKKQHFPSSPLTNESSGTLGPTPSRSQLGMSRRQKKQQFRTPFRVKVPQNSLPKTNSGVFLRGVFLMCILVQFFTRPWLLNLLPIPILIYMLKNGLTCINFGILDHLQKKVVGPLKKFMSTHSHVLLPYPFKILLESYVILEKELVKFLPNLTDSLVTAVLIIFMIFGVGVVSVFVSLELYSEVLYMVQSSGKMIGKLGESMALKNENGTLSLDPAYQQNIEEFLETAYLSGRDFISSSIQQLVGKNNNETSSPNDIEVQVLELWDRLYQYWLSKKGGEEIIGPNVTNSAITMSFDNLLSTIMDEKSVLNWSSIAQFCKDNMGTFMSIIDQAWVIVKGNVGAAMTILFEVVKLLFSGSTEFVNFLLNLVIYFTALFYLLMNSGKVYKPVEVMTNYSNLFGAGFGDALDKAITSIFWLTIKMVGFYSLYTYLTHSLFQASIVMVPVLVAAFLAAIPITSHYIVPLPAALELWLSRDRPLAAVLLIACHVAPTLVVDSAMYAEVRGGIHPWLTGLSIVGGIYYFGVAGTIYGPLILCAVYVVMSMYPNALKDFQVDRPRLATPVLKRSESIY